MQPDELRTLRQDCHVTQVELATMLDCNERTISRWEKGKHPIGPQWAALINDKLGSRKIGTEGEGLGSEFTFVDLFAGIGGMRLGFENEGGRCVYSSEWNRFARQTYKENFQDDEEIGGDITQIPSRNIPPHDLLLAGFPCQPFSLAGVSKNNSLGRAHGFAHETHGTLFFEIARILRERKPEAFLLENVKNLQGHDGGRTMEVILRTLREDCGYTVPEPRVLDAAGLLPQHRERVFIAGFRESDGFDMSMVNFPSREEGPRLRDILHPEDGSEKAEPPYTVGEQALVADKYTLSDKLWSYLQEYAERHRKRGNGFGYGLVGPDDVARTLSARYYKDGSEILVEQKGRNPRRLTPRECSRLLGFPKRGGRDFEICVSDAQAYRQFGNAVAVPVVERIAEAMRPHIHRTIHAPTEQLELPVLNGH
jgi:DNA (cytosine-5)-methyltransferase 1